MLGKCFAVFFLNADDRNADFISRQVWRHRHEAFFVVINDDSFRSGGFGIFGFLVISQVSSGNQGDFALGVSGKVLLIAQSRIVKRPSALVPQSELSRTPLGEEYRVLLKTVYPQAGQEC